MVRTAERVRNVRHMTFSRRALAGALLLASPQWPALGQARATLWIRWTSDSSWEGTYLDKPHTFHVREVLDGRLVFELADSSLLPRAHTDAGAPTRGAVDVIQLNENGTSTGATLVEARGTTSYTVDVTKEGGDCTISDRPDTSGIIRAPFIGREEGSEPWKARAPGSALVLLRAGDPVAFAFAPSAIQVESSHRLICPAPEVVRRAQTYRVTIRFGDLLERRGARSNPGEAPWVLQTSRTPLGGYAVRGTYDVVVNQHRALPSDPASASGRLVVSKRVTLAWERGEATAAPPPTPE